MVMNQMFHFMKQLSGRLSPNVYASVQDQTNAAQIAFLRQLQRELKKEEVLEKPFDQLAVIVFDLETTGFSPSNGDTILSIGAVKVKGSKVIEEEQFYSPVYSESEPPPHIQELTGLTREDLMAAPPIQKVLERFYTFIGKATLVAHHANHEKEFMQYATWNVLRTHFQHRLLDTSFLTKIVSPEAQLITLDDCCSHYEIEIGKRHHALEDAIMTAKLWGKNVEEVKQLGFETLSDVYAHLAKRGKR